MKKTTLALAAAVAVVCARAEAAVITTQTTRALDAYTGSTDISAVPFSGDASTLTGVSIQVAINVSERVLVVGGNGNFTFHYDASLGGRSIASGTKRESTILDSNGNGTLSDAGSLSFAYPLVIADPFLSVSGYFTPNVGFFPNDGAHNISGSATVFATYSTVPEPASLALLALPAAVCLRRRRSYVPVMLKR